MAGALDRLISPKEQEQIVATIAAAERTTSGEIKVHVEARCPGGDPYRRAVTLFEQLGLTKTKERNAALVYVAVTDRSFAIIGDQGIHAHVGEQFWQDAAARMKERFGQAAIGEGIVLAVQSIGERLAAKFPHRADDVNEIADAISTEPPRS